MATSFVSHTRSQITRRVVALSTVHLRPTSLLLAAALSSTLRRILHQVMVLRATVLSVMARLVMSLRATALQAMRLRALVLLSMALKDTALLTILCHITLLRATTLRAILLSMAMADMATSPIAPVPMVQLVRASTPLHTRSRAPTRIRALHLLILRALSLLIPLAALTPSHTGHRFPTIILCSNGALQPPRRMRARQLLIAQLLTLQPLRTTMSLRISRPLRPLLGPLLPPSNQLRSSSKLGTAPDLLMDTLAFICYLFVGASTVTFSC